MNKKKIIITIVVIIILAVGGGIWKWKQTEVPVPQGQNESQQNLPEDQNQDNLVWYEIPELGVKFKVTVDTKNDLKYEIRRNENTVTAITYSQSEVDFLGKSSCFDGDGIVCSGSVLSRFSVKENERRKNNDEIFCQADAPDRTILAIISNDIICRTKPQADPIGSKHFLYEDYIKDKKFGDYIESTIKAIE